MKIEHLKQAIMLCREAGVTPSVWGHRGLGKSSIIRQLAADNQMGFIDFRASQIESSDLRGLPDREDGRTVFRPPADLPQGGMSYEEYIKTLESDPDNAWKLINTLQAKLDKGILFLDELSRAADDVLQACFQLVLDRTCGQYTLPPGWSIVVASNFMEGYMTNGFNDPAFLDRFCHLTLSTGDLTLGEWVDYITDAHGEDASTVVEFATQNVKHLDGDIRGELGFRVEPSRRSWDAVIRVDKAYKEGKYTYSNDARVAVIAGLVGMECALAYSRYDCPVKPRDLVQQGVDAMSKKLESLTRPQMTGLMWGLTSILKTGIADKDKEKSAKYGKVAIDFVKWICQHGRDKDAAVAFCTIMVGTGRNDDLARERIGLITNPKVAALIVRTRTPDKPKVFIDYINDDKEVQKMLAGTAFGNFVGDDK